nr:unnamed protein product [Callosobruchus analis]
MTDIWRRSGVRYPDKCPIPPVDTAVTALESAEVCKNQNSGGITYLKYEKINRTTKALSLNMTLTSPIDSNVGVRNIKQCLSARLLMQFYEMQIFTTEQEVKSQNFSPMSEDRCLILF